jgi:hypothetical protein
LLYKFIKYLLYLNEMRLFDNYISVFFFIFFFALLGWHLILFFTNQTTTQWNYLFNTAYALLYFSAGVVGLFGVKLHGIKSAVGREVFAIALGMFGFSIGLFIWSYYNIIAKVGVPFPSIADFFFVLYIPFIGYGIINLLGIFGLFYSKRIMYESLTVFILVAILIVFLGNPPDLSTQLPLLTKALNVFYLLGDTFLVTLGVMLIRLTQGRINSSFFFFIGALLVMACADLLFSYRTGTGIYWNGDISDLLYAFAGFLFSMGVTKIVYSQVNIAKGMTKK